MDKNWYTNESVRSLSFFYPDLQEDLIYIYLVYFETRTKTTAALTPGGSSEVHRKDNTRGANCQEAKLVAEFPRLMQGKDAHKEKHMPRGVPHKPPQSTSSALLTFHATLFPRHSSGGASEVHQMVAESRGKGCFCRPCLSLGGWLAAVRAESGQ